MATELFVISAPQDFNFSAMFCVDWVGFITLSGMPIEDEKYIILFEDQNFIWVVFGSNELIAGIENVVIDVQFDHRLIKLEQEFIPEVFIIR